MAAAKNVKLMKSIQKLTITIKEEFLVMHNHKWVCVYTMEYLHEQH